MFGYIKNITEPLFEFPESYRTFPLAIYFTYVIVNFHVTLFITSPSLSSPPTMSIGLFSMSVSPRLSWKYIHQYHLFRFHICVNIRCLYFSFWLTSLKSGIGRQMGKRFRREGTWVVYLWLIRIECMYVCMYVWQKITKLCKAIILQLKKS